MDNQKLLIMRFKGQRVVFLGIQLILALAYLACSRPNQNGKLELNDKDYFESQGLNVLVFSNWYDGLFSDAKMSGVEIIHHGVRTVTNGDVRLNNTPEQWDPIPQFKERRIDTINSAIEAFLHYPDYEFDYSIRVVPHGKGFLLSVNLPEPLPAALEGVAGLNLEFLPSAYFERLYSLDDLRGIFPLHPTGGMGVSPSGETYPLPLAAGNLLTLAPEDPERRVTVRSLTGDLALFDGRTKAQNGWFVVRSLIPSGKSGKVIEWEIIPNAINNWVRKPVVGHSQVGYHPSQRKVAVIEHDVNDRPLSKARLLRIDSNGSESIAHTARTIPWGQYLRYVYATFDFSSVTQPGIYTIEYGTQRTHAFRIDKDVYATAWHPTNDVFFPVQMDHMRVREAYRIWHDASHLDDALQAPVNHKHFDLFAQGPETDSKFKPGQHIPGLNIGGWYDAGDFDIRTQSHYATVLELVNTWESFRPMRDETMVDYKRREVEIFVPDGKPDILQQIEHGTLALIAQHRAVGHAISGIVEPDLRQYTHLGDGGSKTDNKIYNPRMADWESNGVYSGKPDDRWAFTTRTSPLNYGSASALAAASRALRGYNDELADECIATAKRVWNFEQTNEPKIFVSGNTTGGPLEAEMLKAAVELLITTRDATYADAIWGLMPYIKQSFGWSASWAIRVLPLMDNVFYEEVRNLAREYKNQVDVMVNENPYGVPITRGGWAGNGAIMRFASTNYSIHKAFPEIMDAEYVFRGLNYIFGCHPSSNISFVSAVGAHSKRVAYGMNRADFSFIAGGIVPGVLVLPPDFPENKEDWPFLWGQNEYVIPMGSSYIYLVHAVDDLLKGM